MKKVLFMMAIAGMFGFAACNNNTTAEPAAEEATPIEAVAEESTEPVENAVEEVVEGAEEAVEETAAE